MPIKVILQNIYGTHSLKSVVDPYGGLNKCLPMGDEIFPLLQYVDPYGNTVFNSLQMPQILKELEVLINRCEDAELKVLLEKVEQLAMECSGHLYLRFVGD